MTTTESGASSQGLSSEDSNNSGTIVGATAIVAGSVCVLSVGFFALAVCIRRNSKKAPGPNVELAAVDKSVAGAIPTDEIRIRGEIGEGAFGKVYKGEWNGTTGIHFT